MGKSAGGGRRLQSGGRHQLGTWILLILVCKLGVCVREGKRQRERERKTESQVEREMERK